MAKSDNLHKAKKNQNDEFYTQYEDIEIEMNNYEKHFKGKTVLMNCDDPTWSNFWKYFHLDFQRLGLKKIIATHYEPDLIPSYKMEYTGGDDENFEIGIKTDLTQNGDFRSPECIELLKESDIIITNPPFSLFREYVAQLMEYGKKFLIIGNKNSITYKEFFPLIKDNKVWIGYNSPAEFDTPEGVTKKINGLSRWFTNLDIAKRHEFIETTYEYNKKDKLYPDLYLKYDNYDAINIDKVSEIPMDYNGIMGVPITFLDKYCPEQFEILELGNGRDNFTPIKDYINPKMIKNGKESNGNALNRVLAYPIDKIPDKGVYYTADNSDKLLFAPYARILIRKKVGV